MKKNLKIISKVFEKYLKKFSNANASTFLLKSSNANANIKMHLNANAFAFDPISVC